MSPLDIMYRYFIIIIVWVEVLISNSSLSASFAWRSTRIRLCAIHRPRIWGRRTWAIRISHISSSCPRPRTSGIPDTRDRWFATGLVSAAVRPARPAIRGCPRWRPRIGRAPGPPRSAEKTSAISCLIPPLKWNVNLCVNPYLEQLFNHSEIGATETSVYWDMRSRSSCDGT